MSASAKKAAIITYSANGTIGPAGESTLPWTSKEDKDLFRAVTRQIGTVVVGNKTLQTMEGRPLSGRMNYVLTRNPQAIEGIDGKLKAVTLEEFRALKLNDFCVIGGKEIYTALVPSVDVVYISRHKHVEVDGEKFELDAARFVLFSRKDLHEIVVEIYTQPSFIHPEIKMEYDDNEFMEAARRNVEKSLDANHPTSAVLVNRDGEIIGYGANGSRWHEEHANDPELKEYAGCRRKLLNCPSGTGYEHCQGCSNENHAEVRAIQQARENGHDCAGATCYLWGHWWCCEPCSRGLVAAGVRQVRVSREWTRDFLGIYTD